VTKQEQLSTRLICTTKHIVGIHVKFTLN